MNTQHILKTRSQNCSTTLLSLWQISDALLIATGGFGRESLYPLSDVDVLILSENPDTKAITAFVQAAWDSGLKISHSVRSIKDVLEDVTSDLSLYTSILESRLLSGDKQKYQEFMKSIQAHTYWTTSRFITDKIKEQHTRHEKFRDNLEPHLKYCIGGQRDIQTLFWLMLKSYGSIDYNRLISEKLITPKELYKLKKAHLFISRVRYEHELISPNGGKIRFDEQITLAQELGYLSDHKQKDVEYFMKDLFVHMRHVVCITEKIYTQLGVNPNAKYQELPELKALVQASELMCTKAFRQNTQVKENFMSVLKAQTGISHNLKYLSNTEVLSKLFPGYRHTLGQMQFDLYHIHSVDVHTIEVIRQIREMILQEHKSDLPICTDILKHQKDHSALYLAALFHDMGKGRGVDHSLWGADAAAKYLKGFPLKKSTVEHICWLVKEHLLFSLTAQKKDITDINTISEFAKRVESLEKLNDLYVLTVADIRGTNPKLWTGHKSALLKQLYLSAKDYLTSQHNYSAPNTHIGLPNLPVQLGSNTKSGQCELVIHIKRNRYLFANVTSTIDSLDLNIAWAQTQTLGDDMILHRYVLLDKDGQTLTDKAIFQDIQKRVTAAINSGSKPKPIKRRDKPESKAFNIIPDISITPTPDNTRLEIAITTADRPGLLSQIASTFAEFDLRLHSAKINTIGEKADDIFWVFNDAGLGGVTDDLIQSLLKIEAKD